MYNLTSAFGCYQLETDKKTKVVSDGKNPDAHFVDAKAKGNKLGAYGCQGKWQSNA